MLAVGDWEGAATQVQASFLETVRRAASLVQAATRVSLRALRVELDLEDDRLADLVYELVEVRRVAIRDGDVLVAIGSPVAPESAAEHGRRAPTHLLPGVGDTDHRNLTVLFCDLVGSTELSTTMDSEDYGEAIRIYHGVATEVVTRFGGFVAQLLGDGLLVLFGYPEAQEHSAEQAVRAALELVQAVQALGRRLSVRVGVHFGPCVIRRVGAGGRQDTVALGETPNTAARVQSVAKPGEVLLSDVMYRVVDGWFVCEEAGTHALKGLPEPMTVYRVLRPSPVRSRLEARGSRGLAPFVGRDVEQVQLLSAWQRARAGRGHVIHVSGEPGIGKSRLARVLHERVVAEPHRWLEGSCVQFMRNTAFHPIVEVMERLFGFEAEDSLAGRLRAVESVLRTIGLSSDAAIALFTSFLSLPHPSGAELTGLSAEARRRRTIEGLADGIVRVSEIEPLVLLVEDLHWSDPSSLEAIRHIIGKVASARILVLTTSRPEFALPWADLPNVDVITLEPMNEEQAREVVQALLAQSVAGRAGPDRIVERAGGNPLFLEELSQAVLESADRGAAVDRVVFEIPTTLQSSLLARLDRLGSAKPIAQVAAVIGREFTRDMVLAVMDQAGAVDAVLVDRALVELTNTGLVQRAAASKYVFKHALVQDAASQSLLKTTRRELHARVVHVLRAHFPDRLAGQPEVAARHAEAGGLPDDAIDLYLQAAELAAARSAHEEAFGHLSRALALVDRELSGDDHDRQETRLRQALAVELLQVRGHAQPETRAELERVRTLATARGDDLSLAAALIGLALASYAVADLGQAHALAEEVLALGEKVGSEPHVIVALATLTGIAYFSGQFRTSREFAERALALYRPERHHRAVVRLIGDDSGITALSTSGWALHQLGAPAAGLERCREAVRLAASLASPFCVAQAKMWEASLMAEGNREDLVRTAEDAQRFAEEQGFPTFAGSAKFLVGYSRGDPELLLAGSGEVALTGTLLMAPVMFCYLADTYLRIDRLDEAAAAIDAGLQISATTGQHSHDSPMLRLRGEIRLRAGGGPEDERHREAEGWFRQALAVAAEQESSWYRLRAALSLARLLRQEMRDAAIRPVLQPIYDSFTDGFDTPLLREAAALLAATHA